MTHQTAAALSDDSIIALQSDNVVNAKMRRIHEV